MQRTQKSPNVFRSVAGSFFLFCLFFFFNITLNVRIFLIIFYSPNRLRFHSNDSICIWKINYELRIENERVAVHGWITIILCFVFLIIHIQLWFYSFFFCSPSRLPLKFAHTCLIKVPIESKTRSVAKQEEKNGTDSIRNWWSVTANMVLFL